MDLTARTTLWAWIRTTGDVYSDATGWTWLGKP